MNDFERIAKVIKYLVAHFREQPNLDSMAKVAGMSPHHFHRLFHKMTGTTPKGFIQHLTLVEAGKLLRNGEPVLSTSFQVGLSGPGRLHDLCVKLEAASPGEIRRGGLDWAIKAGFAHTPFGDALIADGPRGICKLSFVEDQEMRCKEWEALKKLWPNARILEDNQRAKEIANQVFSFDHSLSKEQPLKLFVQGSDFQIKVWRALIEVPYGHARTYHDIAKIVGSSSGSRAVGRAIGSNVLGFIIPCHRVIYSTGKIGHYRWGSNRKKAMLAWEHGNRLE